jgi:hypothetical protein
MNMKLVDTGGVVDVSHDLLGLYSSLLFDVGHARLQHRLKHGDVAAPEITEGSEPHVSRNREPVQDAPVVSCLPRTDLVVPVDALGVRQEEEILVGAPDCLFLLLPVEYVNNPLLARAGNLL